ncbi:MAG: hypothetical protein K8S13_12175 [Desulfobacula sp.]|uniref:hypothetical protein n=1 Tax=Desulfobacula sp. TaxID=2593537 RepID=UPI0025C186CF|nr:hypothetical protein [Desulfobacula sp.]MCD4720597.1 hypothetical protein [Desulfobacula sp.]
MFNRKSRAAWEKDTGGKSISESAAEKACFIMKNHVPVFLPEGVMEKMDKILMEIKGFSMEGGSDGITWTLNPCSRVRLPGSPPFEIIQIE